MQRLLCLIRSITPTSRQELAELKEACDAAAADLARCKWLELESERQQAHADTLQERLAGMKIQETQLCTRLKQLECELQSRDQQLLQLLQSEQNGCQLRTQLETQLEQQTTRLLAAQQELQQVELMWQQDCKHAAMATASTTVAWTRFNELTKQLLVVILRAAAALEILNRSGVGSSSTCYCCRSGLPKAIEVLHALVSLRHVMLRDKPAEADPDQEQSAAAVDHHQQQQQQQQQQQGPSTPAAAAAGASDAVAVTASSVQPTAALQDVIDGIATAVVHTQQQQSGNCSPRSNLLASNPRLAGKQGAAVAAAGANPRYRVGKAQTRSGSYLKAAAERAAPAVALGRSCWKETGRVGRTPRQPGAAAAAAAAAASPHTSSRRAMSMLAPVTGATSPDAAAANSARATPRAIKSESALQLQQSSPALLSDAVRQQEDHHHQQQQQQQQQWEQWALPGTFRSESVIELQRLLSASLSEAVNAGNQKQQQQQQQQQQEEQLLLAQQRLAVEQAVLYNIAQQQQQQQQQQQCMASAPATPFCQSPSPAEQQQTVEGFQQYCNPLWAEWSNPNF